MVPVRQAIFRKTSKNITVYPTVILTPTPPPLLIRFCPGKSRRFSCSGGDGCVPLSVGHIPPSPGGWPCPRLVCDGSAGRAPGLARTHPLKTITMPHPEGRISARPTRSRVIHTSNSLYSQTSGRSKQQTNTRRPRCDSRTKKGTYSLPFSFLHFIGCAPEVRNTNAFMSSG